MPKEPRLARAALHYWEEPCISGKEGSGTVFFSGCTLQCVFCQNHQIADGTVGRPVTEKRLTEIFLELQKKGANNINLVTPGHFLDTVIPAIQAAKREGLTIPVVYNTGGYEKPESLKKLSGLVDIWLPDMKYRSGKLAKRYSYAEDYPKWAALALEEMVRQVNAPIFDKRGMMRRGVIVRHLVLPGYVSDSKDVLEFLWDHFGNQIYISILSQYTPLVDAEKFPELCRRVTEGEYREVVDYARFLGIKQAYIQESECAEESFIPDFDYQGL